jgi:hypothetical protein
MSDESKLAWDDVRKSVESDDPEDVLSALANYFDVDAAQQTHDTVRALLESAAEHCRTAAFEYYASWK